MTEKRTLLTKEYLQFLGVKEVHEDGTVIGAKGKPIECGSKYKVMGFNRAELGKPFNIYIHHIVWVWFNGQLEADTDIHHIDMNPSNNALSNLVAMSHAEHLRMHKLANIKESNFMLKCNLNKPRSFYEDLLSKYEEEYLKAPELYGKSTDPRYKRVVANVANTKARLRYYDKHIKEAIEMSEFQMKKAELAYWKKCFRTAGNKAMHKECIKVEKVIKEASREDAKLILDHALDVIHKTF